MSVGMKHQHGAMSADDFWKKSFVYLKTVALLCVIMGVEDNDEEEESDLSLRRRCPR